MNKILKIFSLLFLLTTSITNCGFQPVYNAKNSLGNSTIYDYKIYTDNKEIEKILSNLIIRSTQTLKSDEQFFLEVSIEKIKKDASKDKTGKIDTYKISLIFEFVLKSKDQKNKLIKKIIQENFNLKKQSSISITEDIEKKLIENYTEIAYGKILFSIKQYLKQWF